LSGILFLHEFWQFCSLQAEAGAVDKTNDSPNRAPAIALKRMSIPLFLLLYRGYVRDAGTVKWRWTFAKAV